MGGLRGPGPAACAFIVPSPTITTVLPLLHGPGDSVPQKVLGTNKVELPGDQVAQVSRLKVTVSPREGPGGYLGSRNQEMEGCVRHFTRLSCQVG